MAGSSHLAHQPVAAERVAPPATGRVQLALDVDDLAEAVEFYSTLFGVAPAKLRPGYANFAIAAPPLKLVLLENPGKGGRLNHLGVEVPTGEDVRREIARLTGAGMALEEETGTTCCYAAQDKAWVTGPGGEHWEVYTVVSDSATFGASAETVRPEPVPDASRGGAEAAAVCCAGVRG